MLTRALQPPRAPCRRLPYPACQARVFESPDRQWWGQMRDWKDEGAEGWAPPLYRLCGGRKRNILLEHLNARPWLMRTQEAAKTLGMMSFLTWLSMEGGGVPLTQDQNSPPCQEARAGPRAIRWYLIMVGR